MIIVFILFQNKKSKQINFAVKFIDLWIIYWDVPVVLACYAT